VVLIACGSDAAPAKDPQNTDALGADAASATPAAVDATVDAASESSDAGSSTVIVDAATPADAAPDAADATTPVTTVDPDAGTPPVVVPDAGPVVPPLTPDQVLEASYSKKFLECSGLNGGTLPADYFTIDDDYARCIANCVLADSCDNIGSWFCGGGATNGKGSVYACINKCPLAPGDGFACAGGKTIPHAYVCDLGSQLDCSGKDDEKNCTLDFQCGSGERLPMRLRCDGYPACDDGSDEPAECARCK
jgi:hypothetical protein